MAYAALAVPSKMSGRTRTVPETHLICLLVLGRPIRRRCLSQGQARCADQMATRPALASLDEVSHDLVTTASRIEKRGDIDHRVIAYMPFSLAIRLEEAVLYIEDRELLHVLSLTSTVSTLACRHPNSDRTATYCIVLN